MLDWTQPENYLFTQNLSADEWAWEFLRRNKNYRREWSDFMTTWNALEAEYGKPPNRDFCAWKLDERAWIPAVQCSESDCRVDEDKVLIECAMGARWGFHKFPPDPEDDKAVAENRLIWRELTHRDEMIEVSGEDRDYLGEDQGKLALGFDLSKPVREQLEQAKRYLQLTQKQRVRQGLVELKTLKNMRNHLALCLRVSDALNAGVDEKQMKQAFPGNDITSLIRDSRHFLNKGYLELLELAY